MYVWLENENEDEDGIGRERVDNQLKFFRKSKGKKNWLQRKSVHRLPNSTLSFYFVDSISTGFYISKYLLDRKSWRNKICIHSFIIFKCQLDFMEQNHQQWKFLIHIVPSYTHCWKMNPITTRPIIQCTIDLNQMKICHH